RGYRRVQALIVNVSGNSHDGQSRTVRATEADGLAHRVFFRPKLASHGFIDDNHSGRIERILVGEFPAFQNGDAHCAEVVWTSHAVAGAWHVLRIGRRTPFNLETATCISFERQVADCTDGNNSRYSCHVFLEIAAEERQSRRAHIGGVLWNRHLHREYILWVEPRIDAEKLLGTLDHEPSSREYDER